MNINEYVAELQKELIDVLTKLDGIAPVQFLDMDCDGQIFQFRWCSV